MMTVQRVLDVTFLTICIGACLTEAFLPNKFKDGCDPNPCKNKAICKYDRKNKDLSTCECLPGFHGKQCELINGCSTKPCKKGTCEEDASNPTNYNCNCQAGFVGKYCDTVDACAKSPCKSGKHKITNKLIKLDTKF